MDIIRFNDFINENMHDSPEEYIKIRLNKLKIKIEKLFEKPAESEEGVIKMSDALKKGKEKEQKDSQLSLAELGLNLESSEFSKYSAMNDSIKFIFTDSDSRYDLYITIPLEEGIVKDKTKDFSDTDIKKCFVKFKKYSGVDFRILGQISKNVEIDNIDEDFLVELKIELEDQFGETGETLEIETE
jgi:translation initiation factor 2 alpha subunit (eIF-2alpha)